MATTDEMVVKLRGLPFSATASDVVEFFQDIEIVGGAEGVLLTMGRDGRPSGECYVELVSQDDIPEAEKKNNEHMGKRYIEVFTAKRSEMEWFKRRQGDDMSNKDDSSVVRLRGIPFECNKEDITKFFDGIEIYPNGIAMPLNWQGRPSGEAFVQFISKSELEKALERDKEKIGHRYIEIFRSSIEEVRVAMEGGGGGGMGRGGGRGGPGPMGPGPRGGRYGGRPSPYDSRSRFHGMNRGGGGGGGGGGGYDDGPAGRWGSPGGGPPPMGGGGRSMGAHMVNARGLPFSATEQDIADFFLPLTPTNIHIIFEGGRPSGRADVEFATHDDALEAMKKDKENMQSRYIELFLDSRDNGLGGPAGPMRGGGGYGNGYNEGPDDYNDYTPHRRF